MRTSVFVTIVGVERSSEILLWFEFSDLSGFGFSYFRNFWSEADFGFLYFRNWFMRASLPSSEP